MKHLVQEHISTLMPYIPGKPISEVQRELGLEKVAKLASNENPCGPSPKAIQAVRKALNELHLYPDGSGYHLKKALAEKLRVNPDQIILGNGTNEILEIVVRTFLSPGEATISGNPAFIIYSMLTQAAHGKNRPIPLKNYTHDLEAMAAAISSETKIIFIANPNNPTGTMVGHEEFIRFLQKVPGNVIVVVDEAYYEYVEDGLFPDLLSYLQENPSPPILITRTFSKAYGLAGLRVGYGIGPSEMIALMNRVRQPFNVNTLALVAAEATLGDGDHLQRSREVNRLGYQYLCREFDRLKLTYIPSQANFILVDVGQDAKIFSDRLLREGVIIRPMGGYGLASSARITIGLPEENQKLIEAMERIL